MIYYDIDYDCEHHEIMQDTPEKAKRWAQKYFEDKCDMENSQIIGGIGKHASDVAYVVTMKLDNNDEPQEIDRDEFAVEWEWEEDEATQHRSY
jgi:hypothetical protein